MPSGDADLLFSRLRSFLSLIMRDGPSTLAAAARDISQQDAVSHLALLDAYWSLGAINNHIIWAFAQFIPLAFSQSLSELLAACMTAVPSACTVPRGPL